MAILFPWAARDLLLAKFEEGKLTIDEIAQLVDLPTRYVRLVMSNLGLSSTISPEMISFAGSSHPSA